MASESQARTSLQRLLQLNEAGRSLEECLNDAAQILAFEKSWDDLSIPTRDVVAEDQLSHKRPEWLLHWILEKLNSQPNAYNSARAWIFLWRLLPLVPKSILARNLIASKFLDSVEKALASDDSGSHDPAPCRTIVASSMVENETSSQSKGEISRSRKRKRGSSSPSPDPNGAVDSSSGIRGDPVLVMLSKILEYLVDLVSSDAKDTGTIESQHLNAVFQTSFNNAVRIMHHWQLRLLALSITITDEHRITLSPILYILGSAQDLPTNQSSDMLNIFAEECLVTSMRLFRDLMPATLSESADLFDSSSSKTSSQAEQALAKYVLLPARSRYLAATREKNNADKEFYSLQLFEPFLRPFQSQLLLDASSFGRYSAELRSLLSTIPQLWRLAIQIVPRSTPKRRSAEEPWLRALFVALAEYSGSSITGDWSIAVHPHSAIVLGEMLDVCSEYSISLTPSLLESIVRRYSGMCLSEEESIYWSLVAKVLRLDATVFLPGRPSSPLEFVDDSGPLHQLVLRHLSSMPWKDEFDPFNPAQKTTDAVQRQKSAAAFFDLNGMTTAEFRASLPISLMQAYARNRILSGFLDVWRRELIKSTRHIVLGSGHSTIWEDQDFAAALRQLLESSLTEAQIHEELTKYGQPFEELEETQNILYIFTELRRDVTGTGAAANIVLLDALIGAIKTDSVVEASRDRLLLLYRNLIKIGSKPAINKHNIMFRIWRIISGVRRLLDPLQAQDELQSLSKEAVDSACFHAALDAVGEAHRNLLPVSFARAREGLRFALRVSSALAQTKDNALKDQFVPLTEMFLNISFDWVNPKSESAPLHWYKLEIACILVEHGFIFNILDSEHRQSLFRGTFHLAEMSFRYDSELPADAPRPHADVLDALYDTLARSGKSGSREDYFNTLLQELTKENRGQHTSDTSPSLTEHVSKIHGRSFPRSFVEQLSDRLLERLRSPRADPVDASQVSRHLALLLKMMGLPHGCSRPGMNVDFLQILGRNTELEPTTLRKPFEQVVRKMLENEPSGSSLRENILPLAKSELIGGNGYERGDISIGALSMVLAAIPFSTIQDFDLLFRPKDLDNWLQRQLDAFVRDPGTIKNEAHITLLLEIIVAICRLARQPYMFDSYYTEDVMTGLRKVCAYFTPNGRRAIMSFLLWGLNGGLTAAALDMSDTSFSDLSAHHQQEVLAILSDRLSQSDGKGFKFGGAKHLVDPNSKESTTVLYEVFKKFPQARDDDERSAASALFIRFVNLLSSVQDSWLVSQYSVDALLSSLIKLTSSTAPSLDATHGDAIYVQICMICNSLIFLHRIKLRGRFHLLMELLSNLLFCLFVPHDRKSKPVGLPAPVWLVAKGTTLSTKHATAYTRVLTTLCSPTVSSAAGTSGAKRRRHDGDVSSLPLKDDVKRERARVGQFVPQLLASYCVAQLEGKLMPHVKSALMPGLWAAMDTVEVETWRAMSSGLDAPARAIWSQTWAEWRRIGGGTKKLRGT